MHLIIFKQVSTTLDIIVLKLIMTLYLSSQRQEGIVAHFNVGTDLFTMAFYHILEREHETRSYNQVRAKVHQSTSTSMLLVLSQHY